MILNKKEEKHCITDCAFANQKFLVQDKKKYRTVVKLKILQKLCQIPFLSSPGFKGSGALL